MSDKIFVKTYSAPPIDEREILRYAGCKEGDGGVLSLLKQTLLETENAFSYRVCYRELSLTEFYGRCPQAETSADLKKLFLGCESVVLFCATVGLAIDRKISEYGVRSPAQAVLAQAIGAERIESLCELFCAELQREYEKSGKGLTSRYSAGYGDLPLSAQKEIFALLDCSKRIGVSLTENLLMTPTKSVSAIVGIGKQKGNIVCKQACGTCEKIDCVFRKNG